MIVEERKKAQEALEEERRKVQEQDRAKAQTQALALQRKEEERRQEQENKLRQQEMQCLLKEKERIRQDRMSILITQLALLIKRKKDLREELLDRRDKQIKTGQETIEYAEQVVNPVLEYWDIGEHTPENACRLPVGEPNQFPFFPFFCFNAVIFFFSPPNKFQVFHGIANHRFSAAQKKQTTVLFISGASPKVRTEPAPFHQNM